jgi:hypothetical protein
MNRRPFRLVFNALYETTVQLSSAELNVRRSHFPEPITAAQRYALAALLAVESRSNTSQLPSIDA